MNFRIKLQKCEKVSRNLAELFNAEGPCASSGGRLPEALFIVFQLDSKGAEVCESCRSRQELSNEYLLAKFGFDTAESEPLKVCQKIAKS